MLFKALLLRVLCRPVVTPEKSRIQPLRENHPCSQEESSALLQKQADNKMQLQKFTSY